MTDSLRRLQDRQTATQRPDNGQVAQRVGWWRSVPTEARVQLLGMVFLTMGTLFLTMGVSLLVGVLVSGAAGFASGTVTFGLLLFVIGVLFGLNNG